MKIAIFVPGGVDRSGDRRVIPALLALIRRLAAVHDVHVFALRQEPEPGSWDLHGARVFNAGARRRALRLLAACYREHRRGAFDVVHCIWSGYVGMIGVAIARMLGVPSLVHVAGGEVDCRPEISYGGRCGWCGRLREALVLRATGRVTAASAPMIEKLSRLGIDADRVPLGADPALWSPREPIRRSSDRPLRLVHVASLNRVKDQATLLQALKLLSEFGQTFHLDVVGEDTLNGSIQSLCRALDLNASVTFHGFLRQPDVRRVVLAADLMLVTSRHEAGPVVVLEAAISGVPTVGTNVGHVSEWAPDAAVAVPIGDSAALAQAILTLGRDENRRLVIAENAMLRATREDADYTARRFEEIYYRLRREDRGTL